MPKKKSSRSSRVPVLIFVGIILLIGAVVFFTTLFKNNAEVVLLVAPDNAVLRLDGRKVKNGSHKIKAGSHKLEISADGLESKTVEFDISKNETKAISAYLADEGFDYYKKHDDQIELLALVADDEARDFVKNYEQSKTILELLPITIAHDNGGKSSTLSKGDNCTRSFCLKIVDDNAELRSEMENMIRQLGYNPSDYEIIYERTNSVENEGE